ncbi:Hypothetical protein BMNI_I0635 [Brucella melitensis NI]|nr:Hypothetical protein BMNI_I0635 [Brucella melitensis NI]
MWAEKRLRNEGGVDDAQCVISPGFVARFGFPTLLPAMVMIRWCSRADHEC